MNTNDLPNHPQPPDELTASIDLTATIPLDTTLTVTLSDITLSDIHGSQQIAKRPNNSR